MAELEGHQDGRNQRSAVAGHRRARAAVQDGLRLPGPHREDSDFAEILADAKIDASQVAYIGDDFTDIVIMRRVGLAIATANAARK